MHLILRYGTKKSSLETLLEIGETVCGRKTGKGRRIQREFANCGTLEDAMHTIVEALDLYELPNGYVPNMTARKHSWKGWEICLNWPMDAPHSLISNIVLTVWNS